MIAIAGFVAARDLPGMLELSILKRLPLEDSVRYAITTLSKYALVFIGLFVACRLVGLRWQQIQWMATALTFGLAFLETSANPYMPNNDPYAQMMQQLGAYTAQMDQFNAQMLQQLNGQMYGGGSGFGSMGGSQPQTYGGGGGFGNNSNSFQTPSGFQAPPNGTSTGTSNGGKKENKFWKAFKAGASQIDPATAGEFAGGFVQGAGFDISGFAVGALFGF